jgi:hypothetical protein
MSADRGRAANGAGMLVLLVTAGTIAAAVIDYVRGTYHNLPFPSNTFLTGHGTAFSEFSLLANAPHYRDLAGSAATATPLGSFVAKLLHAAFGIAGGAVLAGVAALAVAWCLWTTWRELLPGRTTRADHVAALVLLSYPMLVIYDAGAPAALSLAAVCVFVRLWLSRRHRFAWIPLGVAIAVAPSLVMLLAIPAARRRMRQTGAAAGLAAALMLLAMAALAFGTADSFFTVVRGIGSQLRLLPHVAFAPLGPERGHTLWGAVVALDQHLGGAIGRIAHVGLIYAVFAAIVAAGIAYLVLAKRQELPVQLLLLLGAALVLPFWSGDAQLALLLVPAMLLCSTFSGSVKEWITLAVIALLLVPLAPLSLSAVSPGVLLYPGLLVCLLLLAGVTGARRSLLAHEPGGGV